MNGGSLNSFTLNGAVIDPVVRTRVDGFAYAVGVSTPRVLAYAAVSAIARASVPGAIAKVRARNRVQAEARAQASGIIYRVRARLIASVQALANVEATLGAIRGIVVLSAQAVASVLPKVLQRSQVASVASVSATLVARSGIRGLIQALPSALTSLRVTVWPRVFHRVPTSAQASANVSALAKLVGRLRLQGSATADLAVGSRLLIRTPVNAQALVAGVIDFNVIKRIPWDEPAPDERTFKVNPETFVFYVVA